MRALLRGQVHPRQVRPVVEDPPPGGGPRSTVPDQQMRPGLRIRFPQRHPGEAPSMITSIPAALPAIAIASSGSPPRNPPTLASIDECVPVSVNVTTPGLREPRWLASGVRRPAERGPVSRRVQHQPKFCRQRARAQHRLDLDSRSPVRRTRSALPGSPSWGPTSLVRRWGPPRAATADNTYGSHPPLSASSPQKFELSQATGHYLGRSGHPACGVGGPPAGKSRGCRGLLAGREARQGAMVPTGGRRRCRRRCCCWCRLGRWCSTRSRG
jgi:hypothetical protein